jgi:hypothetical protein
VLPARISALRSEGVVSDGVYLSRKELAGDAARRRVGFHSPSLPSGDKERITNAMAFVTTMIEVKPEAVRAFAEDFKRLVRNDANARAGDRAGVETHRAPRHRRCPEGR